MTPLSQVERLEVGRDRWARRFVRSNSVEPDVPIGFSSPPRPAVRRFATLAAALPLLAAFVLLAGCTTAPRLDSRPDIAALAPPAPREFRAVWVSTVGNIDWPSRPGLPADQQRAELRAILDRAQALKLNAIILQVRPAADALYESRLEPWSEYLTGRQGQPPRPYYDPLRVWIDEAHRRGLELHAWLNPYRARHSSARSPLARNHLANVTPAAVKRYGDMLWMDPGEPAAARQTLRVVRDLVSRYDLDGIHIDDYFYPYPVRTAGDFPDEPSFQRYRAHGGTLDRAHWRRENVNTLIADMYRSVHALKPWVQVGVSPFGIGRPALRPSGIAGFSQYDELYADVELWLERGWLDYLAPQLYWRIDQRAQAFPVLFAYWNDHNPLGRHIWPGLIVSSVGTGTRAWAPEEILKQIDVTRAQARSAAAGHVHFSMVALMQDRSGVATKLQAGTYATPALPPPTPWLGTRAPRAPGLVVKDGTLSLRPSLLGERPARFAVWLRHGTTWRFSVLPPQARSIDIGAHSELGPVTAVVVSAVDRLGNESARTGLVLEGATSS